MPVEESTAAPFNPSANSLDNLLADDRTFPPSEAFAQAANLKGEAYERAEADPDAPSSPPAVA